MLSFLLASLPHDRASLHLHFLFEMDQYRSGIDSCPTYCEALLEKREYRLLHWPVAVPVEWKAQPCWGNVVSSIVPAIEDESWFFDTELLVLAYRKGLRITEVPVHWVEDEDSRVKVVKTAIDDLRGIWRLRHGTKGK